MARNKNSEQTIALIVSEARKLFLEKGYDKTSMQDIMNKTKISKGGIYYHFSSKEQIFQTICKEFCNDILLGLKKILNLKHLNGAQKLKKLLVDSSNDPKQRMMQKLMPNMMENPEFLVMQLELIENILAPQFISVILEEGMVDGSIKKSDPLELAELILIFLSIWLNPFIFKMTTSNAVKRFNMVNTILKSYQIELFDKETVESMLKEIEEFYSSKDIKN